MKSNWTVLLRVFALLAMLAGLLVWLLQPVAIPPAEQLRHAASVAGFLLLMAVCTGVAAMATVQFWKILFHPRAAFHATELRRFFDEHMEQVLGLAPPGKGPKSGAPSSAERPDDQYLLNSPTEIVMGQVRSAADYMLLRPEGFEAALRKLAGSAGGQAVETYLQQIEPEESEQEGREDDLVAVRFFVEQHLNLIHVTLRERWRRRVRAVAACVAGLVGLLAILLVELSPMVKISAIFAGAIWGGFFSWFARDLAALVERRRS